MADVFLRKNGITASYINTILMVDNFLLSFDQDTAHACGLLGIHSDEHPLDVHLQQENS